MPHTSGLDRRKMAAITDREITVFRDRHGASLVLLERARKSMPHGVPMSWMRALYAHEQAHIDGYLDVLDAFLAEAVST